jgi:DNA-binding response OmpR family regulator
MKKILLAEDDIDFVNVLKHYLELHEFDVDCAYDGEEAFSKFQKETYNLCVFDVMMPKIDGFTLAEKCIAINPEIPFVFLTARSRNEDKIIGLKLGADDYIVKPFEADELVLRITNIIKRSEKTTSLQPILKQIQIGSFCFDTIRLDLKNEKKTQQLTEKEGALLLFLYQNKNTLLKRKHILQSVWGTIDYFSGRSMDVYISKLRKYFSDDSSISIESIRNVGLEFKLKN